MKIEHGVLGMLDCRISQNQVRRCFSGNISTITHLVRRVRNTGTLVDKRRSRTPRVTSVRQDNCIRQRNVNCGIDICCGHTKSRETVQSQHGTQST